MTQTKKLLIPFEATRAEQTSDEFLIPFFADDEAVGFVGLNEGSAFEFGVVVYIGMAITENDLFAKLIDSGAFIGDVDATLKNLRRYMDQLQTFKVGNIVRVTTNSDESREFSLDLVATTPASFEW